MTARPDPIWAAEPATSRPAKGRLYRADGSETALVWQVPEEVPVAIMHNSVSTAVMMATPADLEDFAVGFSLSESFVSDATAIRNVVALTVENGFCVDIAVDASALKPRTARAIEGRTGCGLCGVEDIADVIRPTAPVTRGFALDPAAVEKAFADLPALQPMNRVNHSVHAAAWVMPGGEIRLVREDIGRHNALDKLLGAVLRQGLDRKAGFVAMTSRCSFELVQKCAMVGIAHLVTISAPTGLALHLAQRAGMTLASRSPDGIVCFH
ncbi:MAG: formate dehydrogenase accessory sulfurtransferase FdhD [Alphaproteobacteria bacterium]|nr:MAG: formate dehydrogenase accessory sulfurtransferase FdhD [Alphaproteobacteria bacterium]